MDIYSDLQDIVSFNKGKISRQSSDVQEVGDYGLIKANLRRDPLTTNLSLGSLEERARLVMDEEIRIGKANVLLYKTEAGRLSITSQFAFCRLYNTSTNTGDVRGKISVIRPYWLGKGSIKDFDSINYRQLNDPKMLLKKISEILVKQIVEMVLMYYSDVETTPLSFLAKEKNTGITADRKYYRDQFTNSYYDSTYTYALILNLADWMEKGFPSSFKFISVPEKENYLIWENRQILLKEEFEEIKTCLKTGNYVKKELIKNISFPVLETTDSKLIEEKTK